MYVLQLYSWLPDDFLVYNFKYFNVRVISIYESTADAPSSMGQTNEWLQIQEKFLYPRTQGLHRICTIFYLPLSTFTVEANKIHRQSYIHPDHKLQKPSTFSGKHCIVYLVQEELYAAII